MADNWYVARGKKKVGPYSLDLLKQLMASGNLQPNDMVLQDGADKWVPVSELSAPKESVSSDHNSKPLGLGECAGQDVTFLAVKQVHPLPDLIDPKQADYAEGETVSHHFSSPAKSRSRNSWLVVLGLVGICAAVFIGRSLFNQGPLPPHEVAKPHLNRAEQECERAIDEHVKAIGAFFAEAKKNTRPFADEAVGWGSKLRLVADSVPFTRGDRHQGFILRKFEEYIFKRTQLEDTVKQVVAGYLAHVRSIEGRMLVDLQADLSDFPATSVLAQVDANKLQATYDLALARAVEATGSSLRADIATGLVSTIAGEVLTQVAVRLGVSAGILGTGAASGWATLGIGAVVGLIVDQIVSWVWNWWADPIGNLAADLEKKLDEINRLIVDGSGNVQGLRARLRQFAHARDVVRRQTVLTLLQAPSGETK